VVVKKTNLYTDHPELAKRWGKEYPNPDDLPQHVHNYLRKRVKQKKVAARRAEQAD
jgi:hypothetical protein